MRNASPYGKHLFSFFAASSINFTSKKPTYLRVSISVEKWKRKCISVYTLKSHCNDSLDWLPFWYFLRFLLLFKYEKENGLARASMKTKDEFSKKQSLLHDMLCNLRHLENILES